MMIQPAHKEGVLYVRTRAFMQKKIQIAVDPEFIDDPEFIHRRIIDELSKTGTGFDTYTIVKRSVDARHKMPKYVLQIEVRDEPALEINKDALSNFVPVKMKPSVLIVGAGPAGYFSALELIEHGIKPVILERGKDVQSRGKDIYQLRKFGTVNPNSNYCFGEGGAGAYSDGKLFSRSLKRGDHKRVLELLIAHGASEDIGVDALAHIGSNKLPGIVKNIRNTILSCGGEIHFGSWVTDLIIKKDTVCGVQVENQKEFTADAVILATGHSARDMYELLNNKNIFIEAKPFALGVRIEHPQDLIDRIQYGRSPRHENLPAAHYNVVCHVDDRAVFSFCMCPGGFIVPTATTAGEIVVNGMSLSRRNATLANSGIVVEISLEDVKSYQAKGPLAALSLQRDIEKAAFLSGGANLFAPAQRMTDFVSEKTSSTLPGSSYRPGIQSAPIHELLPFHVSDRLKKAFVEFGKKLRGFYTGEATVLAVESRTSSPVRITRNSETLMHPQIKNLYPCGEGAGYAGGIMSSALDGRRVAIKIAQRFLNDK